jgi:hypothetical protein
MENQVKRIELTPEVVNGFLEWQKGGKQRRVEIKVEGWDTVYRINGERVTEPTESNYRVIVSDTIEGIYCCQVSLYYASEIDLIKEAKRTMQSRIDELEKLQRLEAANDGR